MNNDLISRQAVIDHINKKREKHLESEDLISRQAAILALAEQIMESALMDNPTTASTDIDRYRPIAELSLRDVPSAQPVIRTEMSSANDTISRQAAIDALERERTYSAVYKYGYSQMDYFKQYNMGLTDGIKALNKLPSAQPEQIARDIATIIENEQDMRVILQNERTETHSCDCEHTETHDWIPVEQELPEDGVTVWVTIKGHDVIRCEDGETLEQAVARISKMRRVSEGFWCEDDKTWYNAGGYPMMVQPIAWMPIDTPEPWKGKGGQDEG